MTTTKNKLFSLISGFFTAAILWIVIFYWQPLPFWILMSTGIVILVLFALLNQGKKIFPDHYTTQDLVWGILSALVLYFLFRLGFILGGFLFPGLEDKVGHVYLLTESSQHLVIGLLLILIIGPGEEIFWRGFMQKSLQQLYNPVIAFLITVTAYTLLHVITGNWALTLAAGVAGVFWGILYLWKQSLAMVIISHVLWDLLSLLILPIN